MAICYIHETMRDHFFVPYLGGKITVSIERSPLLRGRGFYEWQEPYLSIHIPAQNPTDDRLVAAQIIQEWYQAQAADVYGHRVAYFAKQIGVTYKSITLYDPKSRWGSCDRHGNLKLSWRVVMLPMALVDYLIVHELCHRVHFNHSPAYWASVAKILPDYKLRRKALDRAKVHPQLF